MDFDEGLIKSCNKMRPRISMKVDFVDINKILSDLGLAVVMDYLQQDLEKQRPMIRLINSKDICLF